MEKNFKNFREIESLLKRQGRMVNVVSSPEIYVHEWASFSTKNFPENKHAKSGDKVRIIQTDIEEGPWRMSCGRTSLIETSLRVLD